MLLTRPGSAGATPITPKCGRTGTRTARPNGSRADGSGGVDDAGDVVQRAGREVEAEQRRAVRRTSLATSRRRARRS